MFYSLPHRIHVTVIFIAEKSSHVGPQSCGGTIELSSSMPSFTLNSPYYYQTTSSSMQIDCYWYVSSLTGQQVEVTWRDIDTTSEYLFLFDHPTNYTDSYVISKLYGTINIDISPVVSTRGGLVLVYDDYSTSTNGKGFLVDFNLRGKFMEFSRDRSMAYCCFRVQEVLCIKVTVYCTF